MIHKMRSVAAAISAGALLALLAAGPTSAASHAVNIQGNTFLPPEMTVGVGDTVAWHNSDPEVHSVVGGPMNSPDLAPGGNFSATFASPGDVSYTCRFHPYMTGIVHVTSAGAPAPAPAAGAPAPSPQPTTATTSAMAPAASSAAVPAAKFATAAPIEPELVAPTTLAPTTTTYQSLTPFANDDPEPADESEAAMELATDSSDSPLGLFAVIAGVITAIGALSFVGLRWARRPM